MAGPAYWRFPKALSDDLLASPMGGLHYRVCIAILRHTVGHWEREHARISLRFICEKTGRDRRSVEGALKDLKREGVVRVVEPSRGPIPASLAIETDSSKWGRYQVSAIDRHNEPPECRDSADTSEGLVSENPQPSVCVFAGKCRHFGTSCVGVFAAECRLYTDAQYRRKNVSEAFAEEQAEERSSEARELREQAAGRLASPAAEEARERPAYGSLAEIYDGPSAR